MLFRQRQLDLPQGELRTPALFPVRNLGKRSTDNTPAYADVIPDLSTAMINARAIRNREQIWERLTNEVSLREELGAPPGTIVFADSGGFDFASDDLDTTPDETLETQRVLDADICGTVDLPLSPDNRDSENQRRIDRNIEFAIDAAEAHDGESCLFASVHGYDPATIRNGIKYLEQNAEFDGYALGSLVPIRTDYEKVTKLILAARTTTDKHLHVYGLGGLVYQPLLLYLGVDSFDSSAFIRSAGNRNYLIPGFGGQELWAVDELEYLPCPCPVCGTRTLEDIREDRDALVRHNLWALTSELRRFRYVSATDRDIEEYLDLRFQGNEVTQRAYRIAKQQVRRLA